MRMPDKQLGRRRLLAQGLVTTPFRRVVDVVAAMGAMQGQDLPGVIASAVLRTLDGDVADVLGAMDAGEVVRGYPMRGTVFLMAAVDARWVGQLCAVPALRAAQKRQGQHDLTDLSVARARDAALGWLSEAPEGLARGELFARWEAMGQRAAGGVGYHLLARFISGTQVFYGPWNGTDQNVVLAETWLPAASGLEERFNGDRVAAVTELLRRYLVSHGPATIRDFAWWTKLPLAEIRAALPGVVSELETDGADEPSYWRPGLLEDLEAHSRAVATPRLLPGFDEFILGYQDRTFAMTPAEHERLVPGNNGVFGRSIVADGVVRGLWKRGGRAGKRSMVVEPFGALPKTVESRLETLFDAFPWVTA